MGEPIHGIKGAETTVVTDSGKEIRVRYLVVPASRVITSHDAETMAPNKAYPQELQPRNRQRVSMQEQVTAMANELRPADLFANAQEEPASKKANHKREEPVVEAKKDDNTADTRLHPEKYEDAQKGESDHVDDSTSGLAERAGRRSDSDAVGTDDASGESRTRCTRG